MVEGMLGERDVKGWPKTLVGDRVDAGAVTEMGVPGTETCLGGMILVLNMVNLRGGVGHLGGYAEYRMTHTHLGK